MENTKSTIEQVVSAIEALDLDPIKFKLMDKKEGHGWTREQADHYELEYKRFLTLLAKYPGELIAPSTEVDKFWHGHILDTLKYAEDCHQVFGHFLHHFPYFGMRGPEDAANLAAAAENMKRLYEKEFGSLEQAPTSYCTTPQASYCTASQAGYCTTPQAGYCTAPQASSRGATEISQGRTWPAQPPLKTHSRPTLPSA
jgi:hypothetical protein